jgi:hypothetical protein
MNKLMCLTYHEREAVRSYESRLRRSLAQAAAVPASIALLLGACLATADPPPFDPDCSWASFGDCPVYDCYPTGEHSSLKEMETEAVTYIYDIVPAWGFGFTEATWEGCHFRNIMDDCYTYAYKQLYKTSDCSGEFDIDRTPGEVLKLQSYYSWPDDPFDCTAVSE